MTNRINLRGRRFGRLTVLEFSHAARRKSYWHCVCDCGEKVVKRTDTMTMGDTISCGCVAKQRLNEGRHVHGGFGSREYSIWLNMRNRCRNPNHDSFAEYGGAGIDVCQRWDSFSNFIEDMGLPMPHESIDRIDGVRGYEPENCRWADNAAQARNKRSNIVIEHNGRSQVLTDWARELGINEATLHSRIRVRNWAH